MAMIATKSDNSHHGARLELAQMDLNSIDKDTEMPFANFPGFLLRVASNQTMARLGDLLKVHNLTVVEATIILLIARNEGYPQRWVGDKLSIASANLTPMLSKLEKRGLIRREPIDGRSKGLYLSKKGAALSETLWEDFVAFEKGLIEQIPKHLRSNLIQALSILGSSITR